LHEYARRWFGEGNVMHEKEPFSRAVGYGEIQDV